MSDELIDDEPLPKSKFKYGGKALHELTHRELLDAVSAIWDAKNEEIGKLKAERDGLRQLLSSPFPIHSLWRGFADNAVLLIWIGFIGYLLGAQ